MRSGDNDSNLADARVKANRKDAKKRSKDRNCTTERESAENQCLSAHALRNPSAIMQQTLLFRSWVISRKSAWLTWRRSGYMRALLLTQPLKRAFSAGTLAGA
jgi:hypothetical protein